MSEPSLHLVRAFVCVVERHGFAKAARELGMTASSVSRLVKTLEQDMGVHLLNRTTRAMSLTEAGQRYFDDCSAALERLRGAYARARDEQGLPRGLLKVSTSVAFARSHVVPHLAAFMQAYPELKLDLLITDRYVDIVAEGVALAIRIGHMEDSSLVARKLLGNRRILAAAPRYLERFGVPSEIDELAKHECLVSTMNHDGETWRLNGLGVERAFRPQGRLRADNGDAVLQLAIDGMGIVFRSSVSLAASLRAGELVRLLPQWSGRETGVYAVCPARPPGAGARALMEFLASRWNEESALS